MGNLKELATEVIKAQKAEFRVKASFESSSNMDGSEQQSVILEYTGNEEGIENMSMGKLRTEIVSRAYSDIMSTYNEPGNEPIIMDGDNGILIYGAPGRGILVMAQESDLNLYITAIIALD